MWLTGGLASPHSRPHPKSAKRSAAAAAAVHMGEHGEASRRRPAAKKTPLEDDDLLGLILSRLPPRPSSLPRASLVCKRWLRVVAADPHFLRSFRARHRRPPFLGFFSQDPIGCSIELTPALDPPDRLPAARFTLPVPLHERAFFVIGCRHGRVLAIGPDDPPFYLVVWDPVTGDQLRLPLPPAFDPCRSHVHGAVVCAAGDEGHVHGNCSSSPFQVVAVSTSSEGSYACLPLLIGGRLLGQSHLHALAQLHLNGAGRLALLIRSGSLE
ncbi:hypothetical protein ACP4OV_003821 [Aristida adscensionis]